MTAPSIRKASRKPQSTSFAGARVDDEQALFDGLFRYFRVLHRLALRHLGAMTLGLAFIDGLAHGSPL